MAADGTTAPIDDSHMHNPTAIDQLAIQWDGDGMCVHSSSFPCCTSQSSSSPSCAQRPRFNIYIYDYCMKRGFRKTAQELQNEASIPASAQPPINAKQGLLFE